MQIFLNQKITDVSSKQLLSLTPGVLESRRGVFETMRVYSGDVFAMDLHWDRFARGLRRFRLRSPVSRKAVSQQIKDLIEINGYNNARARIAVWDEGGRIRSAIVLQPIPPGTSANQKKGVHAEISSVRRNRTPFSHVKSIDYRLFRKALEDARGHGRDEALLFNNSGQLVEGATSNVFVVRNAVVRTPPVSCGCLNGVTRRIVLGLMQTNNIPYRIRPLSRKELSQAEEVFITNSLIEVTPLAEVDGRDVGSKVPGPLTRRLQALYRELVRKSLTE